MILKNLVSTRGERPPLRKYVGKKSMSVLIGIICPEAIVLAADSQITNTRTGDFSYVDKISVVDFWPDDEVLVAQAGLWPLTNRVIQIMRKKAKGVKITSAEIVTGILEDSIREAKKPLDKDQKALVDQHQTGLMLAFYVGKKPHIYTIDIYGCGFVNAEDKHYTTIGVVDLAEFLLREYAAPKSHSDMAIASSIFAIKKVKDNNKFCGGDTTIKRIAPLPVYQLDIQSKGKSEKIPQEFVNLAEKRLVKFDEATKKSRDKRVYGILKKTGAELWSKHIKKVEAELKAKDEETNRKRAYAAAHNPVIVGPDKFIENKGEKY